MHSAKPTIYKFLSLFIAACFIHFVASAQENSPYSRYGLGDVVPNQNILNRAMGGITAGYSDINNINSTNPASYSSIGYTTFEIAAETDTRTLKNVASNKNFTSTNALFSYAQLGFPVKMKKANKKGIFLAMDLGLKPQTRINYKLESNTRNSIDSFNTLYEGSGGANEAYIGTALKIKNFSVGFNLGYLFATKNYSTVLTIVNDSVQYYQSSSAYKTNFDGYSFTGGVQYKIPLKNESLLQLGAYAKLKGTYTAAKEINIETVTYDFDGVQSKIDSVYSSYTKGKVVYPATYGFGFVYNDSARHWTVGMDYETTQWSQYKFFDSTESLKNNWKIRVGAEYFPANYNTSVRKYFSFVRYRAGFYYGPNYLNFGTNMPEFGFTFGAGFPLKLRRSYYGESQSSLLNTAFEIGSRGKASSNLRENIFRVSVGFSLSDLWFRRAKYD